MNLMGQGAMGQRVPPFVSKKVRDFAEGQECAMGMPWCNRDPRTTVHCHVREFGMGGMACKPHDFHGYHGCSECHRREKEAGWDDILRAMMITQTRIYEEFGELTP